MVPQTQPKLVSPYFKPISAKAIVTSTKTYVFDILHVFNCFELIDQYDKIKFMSQYINGCSLSQGKYGCTTHRAGRWYRFLQVKTGVEKWVIIG